jgi:DNA-binding SARP family transcriptional activator
MRGTVIVVLPHREMRLVTLIATGGTRSRIVLAAELWPDSTDARALSSLRSSVRQVRHRAPGLLDESRDPLGLSTPTTVDLAEVLLIAEGAGDPVLAAQELLRHEELLPGWNEDWALSRREQVGQRILSTLEHAAVALIERNELDLALEAATRAVTIDPMRESTLRTLTRIHLCRGDKIAALRTYLDFRRRTIEEYGMAPTEQFDSVVSTLVSERAERRRVVRAPVVRPPATMPRPWLGGRTTTSRLGPDRAQRTPRTRNWIDTRGPTALAVLRTAWSQVRWHEPPMTTRSPCPAATRIDVPPARGRSDSGRSAPIERIAIIVSLSRDRPMRSPCQATESRPSR